MILLAVTALAAPAHAAKAAVVKSTAAVRAELGRQAVAALTAASDDEDPEVRALAAESWGRLANRAAVPILRRALKDANADARIAAAASLYKLGEVEGLTSLIDETRAPSGAPPTTPAQELRRMARDAARARAVLRLVEIAGEGAKLALEAARKDAAGEVRDAAAVALSRLGLENSAAVFAEALGDPDEAVRSAAARSLGLIGREGGETLRKLASSDPSVGVRSEAARALGAYADPADIAVLAGALADPSPRVRAAAARALARRGEASSTAALKAYLDKSPAPELALIAQAALAERGEDLDLGLAELTLAQTDPELKSLAIRVLAASSRPQAVDHLSKALSSDPSARTRAEAAAAIVARLRGSGSAR